MAGFHTKQYDSRDRILTNFRTAQRKHCSVWGCVFRLSSYVCQHSRGARLPPREATGPSGQVQGSSRHIQPPGHNRGPRGLEVRQRRRTARPRARGQEAKCWCHLCALGETELLRPRTNKGEVGRLLHKVLWPALPHRPTKRHCESQQQTQAGETEPGHLLTSAGGNKVGVKGPTRPRLSDSLPRSPFPLPPGG